MKRLALGNTWQTFSDPHGAPYIKLCQESQQLRENLKANVFAPMLLRAKAEVDRITSLEESRMIDKACFDVAALGMKPKCTQLRQVSVGAGVAGLPRTALHRPRLHRGKPPARPHGGVIRANGSTWRSKPGRNHSPSSHGSRPVNRSAPSFRGSTRQKSARPGPRAHGCPISMTTSTGKLF